MKNDSSLSPRASRSDEGSTVAALKRAIAFVDKASGTALGVAMSGRHHPNPDGVLTELSQEGMALSKELRVALSKAGA